MSDAHGNFGARFAGARSLREMDLLERTEGRAEGFVQFDAFIGDLLTRLLQDGPMVQIAWSTSGPSQMEFVGLTGAQRTFMEECWSLDRQQERGAWFLEEQVSAAAELLNLPYHYRTHGRFAATLAFEKTTLSCASQPEALCVWSLFEPLCDLLFLPLALRGPLAGGRSAAEQQASWRNFDALVEALGVQVKNEIALFRYGGGWHRLPAQEQLAAKHRLLNTFARQVHPSMGRQYRIFHTHLLVSQYYRKAQNGYALRRQVVTKAFERTLSGLFGGAWLEFLAYLGEEPHPDEQVVTTLPTVRLFLGDKGRAEQAARQLGLSSDEARRMLAAYWQQEIEHSPIEQRVHVLRRYWLTYSTSQDQEPAEAPPGQIGVPKPPDLIRAIEQLWGTKMLPSFPDVIVTEPNPIVGMYGILGQVIYFWDGCLRTAWHTCAGSSYVDITNLSAHFHRVLSFLEEAGAAVDERLFAEIAAAAAHLPAVRDREDGRQTIRVTTIGAPEIQVDGRTYRTLREIISRHRQAWSTKYLDTFLEQRWNDEVGQAARTYQKMLHERGKAPTATQYARHAETAVNHWFGGNLRDLFAAMREPSPVEPQRRIYMPTNVIAFRNALGSSLKEVLPADIIAAPNTPQPWTPEIWKAHDKYRELTGQLNQLEERSLWYFQLQEALGRVPTLKEFGTNNFAQACAPLAMNVEDAWQRYIALIEQARLLLPLSGGADTTH